jgi:hypothetical protein
MDIADITQKKPSSRKEASSSPLVSPTNMRKDALHLNLKPYLVSSNSKTVPKKSKFNLLGINRKKYNFVNSISSKVVPIDCLESQSLDFVTDPIKLKDESKSSFIEKKNIERIALNNYDELPTIRILKDNGNNHMSSLDDHKVTNANTNKMLLGTKGNFIGKGHADERKTRCKDK